MTIREEMDNGVINKHRHRINAVAYSQGHWDAKTDAMKIADKYDTLVNKLFDALCARHADDLVDELREEYGL